MNAGSANGPQYNYYGRNTGANYFGALNPINTTSLDSGRSNSLSLPSRSANSSSTNNQSIPANVQGQSSNQNVSLSPEDQLKSSVGNVLGKDAVSVDQYGTVTLSDGTQVPSLGGFTGSQGNQPVIQPVRNNNPFGAPISFNSPFGGNLAGRHLDLSGWLLPSIQPQNNPSTTQGNQLGSAVAGALGKNVTNVDQYGTVTLSDGTQVPSLSGFQNAPP
ncbi:hypothetical protein [Staphylococcus kloosii]|uniref:hypothetical protein n=1 Tax=Staphylococcus kloosii TaxID=29384 RepID=UPI001E43838B|nr:hypothetical protein [Staphylococcus kloosii]